MAWAKGTATDFIDFLRKFRDYAIGDIDPESDPDIDQGEQVPTDDRWAELSNGALMDEIPSSGMASDGEVYLQGPGSDPDDEIIVGVRTYRNSGANIFGWELRGFTAFDDTLTFETLPGVSPAAYAAFDDAAFNVHFWVNRRRIMALAQIGTTDILVHAGFPQTLGTRGQYPYPLLIGGSARAQDVSFQSGHFGHGCLPDPCENSVHLRWIDGTWRTFRNYTGSGDTRSLAVAFNGNVVWPLRDPTTNANGNTGDIGSERQVFQQFTPASDVYSNDVVGLYQLLDATLMDANGPIARIDGLYVVPGLGLVSGDTITIGGDTYDVFKNTWRTDVVDYFAIKRA